MKILFTLLSIKVKNNQTYLNSCLRLSKEILNQTNHDILISTNNPEHFNDIVSNRVFVRNNIPNNVKLNYNHEFNYNLKNYAFENLSEKYDCIIYLDCDIKLEGWSTRSEDYIKEFITQFEFGADRVNCVLKDEVNSFKRKGSCLFSHKIKSYEIIQKYSDKDDIMNSQLPSEHFLIMKNIPQKIKKFQNKWGELNEFLQKKNGDGGVWGDGFEIGISARTSGLHKIKPISKGEWDGVLGFKFNGNKF